MNPAKKKSRAKASDPVVRAAAILESYFATLPKAKEKKARQDLHKLATVVSRRARGRASQSPRTAQNRPATPAPLST